MAGTEITGSLPLTKMVEIARKLSVVGTDNALTPSGIGNTLTKLNGVNSTAEQIDSGIYPKGGMTIKEPAMSGHLLSTPTTPNTAYREHLEPSGWIDSGTASKLDFMFDPYNISGEHYRIGNIITKVNDDGSSYTNGTTCISTKSAGTHNFGLYPALQFGFQDCSISATPMTLYYFDTSDTIWRDGQQGMWRPNKPVVADKYVTYGGSLYKSKSTGLCGTLPPTHTTGTVSDGVISFEFIRTFVAASIKPCVVLGDRETRPVFGFPEVRVQILKDALVGYAKKVMFLDQNQKSISIQGSANKSLSILDENNDPILIIDMTNLRIDFKKKILVREGIQDYTGSTGLLNQVLVADGTGKCKWQTL